ncbi:hypothetical protein ACTQ33_00935 [Candidatus Avoscillospira sp. LCP25S3_F1]|uniref:hypothetical protein n=1 Tax=Candidatus Avoscillospira sp. LCP25S3_F1 TaxID=3438825 RepID=UPI003F8DC764
MNPDTYLEAITARRYSVALAQREADAAARREEIARQIDRRYPQVAARRAVAAAGYTLFVLLAVLCVFALAAGNFLALTVSAILSVSGIALANCMVYEIDTLERGDHGA